MDEILSKRINLLTNVLIGLCGLGFIALVHRIDAAYKEYEYVALNQLRNCVESIPKNAADADLLADYAQQWLETTNSRSLDAKFRTAASVSEQLKAAGFEKDVRAIKSLRVSQDADPLMSTGAFRLIEVKSPDSIQCCEHGLGNLTPGNKLTDYVQQYRYLMNNADIHVAESIGNNAVKNGLEKQPQLLRIMKSRNRPADEAYYEEPVSDKDYAYGMIDASLKTVSLSGDSLVMSFEQTSSNQINPDLMHASTKVSVASAGKVRLLNLFGIDTHYVRLNESAELKKLVSSYGDLPMEKALEMVGDDYMKAVESIDIFGFTFSTSSLPMALLVFLIFISTGLFLMIREAEKRKLKILTEYDNEEITDYFLKRRWIRTFLWLGLPAISVLVTLPQKHIESMKLYFILAGGATLLILNLATLYKARKL